MKALLIALIAGSALFSNSHDVTTLPSWGPYAKNYAGISKVSDISSGVRVDFSLMPGMYRRNVCVPNLLFESGCHPWNVSPDMSGITYRYELEWKDRVYIDATYHVLDDSTVLLEIHCVNDTDVPQDITLHTVASIACAEQYPQLQTQNRYIAGVRYDSYEPAVRRHNYALVYDGWFRGEIRDPQTLTGSALRTSGSSGDRVTWTIGDCGGQTPIALRCKTGGPVPVSINGSPLTIDTHGNYELVPLGSSGPVLELVTNGNGPITIDAILCGENPSVCAMPFNRVPQLSEEKGSYILKYDSDPLCYGVGWNFPESDVIQYYTANPDIFIRRMVHNHVDHVVRDGSDGHFTSAFQRPLCLAAGRDTTVFNIITCGDKASVKATIDQFHRDEKTFTSRMKSSGKSHAQLLPGAGKYELVSQLIQATILTNIVYPVYTQGEYIRHFTPGKNWNSLYTWDSGFISWGLVDLDPVKAFEIIRAYTTDEDSQSAFIHHGTPLPIHFLAFSQLLSKTGDREMMEYLYPRLKKFYKYMTGHDSSSTTMMPSGLMRTWDYFYNSGGWDDYPPQQDLRSHKDRYPHVTPVVSTAFYIRAAKIMRQCARAMDLKSDVKMYDADIATMGKALQSYAWDQDAGYFGYVEHDAAGKPSGIYRYGDGTNFNMGLDGVSPLVAGICNPEQEAILTDHIFDPERLWTKVGISTVDQSAPYYSKSGYWNGCVWMPHQFVLWKAMLDLGKPELAQKIADTALDAWAFETSQTYQCYEHFMVESGRGKGWHNFSGLSSPMVNWFAAYYQQGTVSTGFDILLCDPVMESDFSGYSANILADKDAAGRTATIILCLNPDYNYNATVDGKTVQTTSPRPGLIYVSVPERVKPSVLKVTASR